MLLHHRLLDDHLHLGKVQQPCQLAGTVVVPLGEVDPLTLRAYADRATVSTARAVPQHEEGCREQRRERGDAEEFADAARAVRVGVVVDVKAEDGEAASHEKSDERPDRQEEVLQHEHPGPGSL